LYAFGFDALDVMSELRSGRTSTGIDGLTGRLTIGANGRIERTLDWARIVGGQMQPAGAIAAPPPSVP
jgi:outer membrane PBP1 activator LpoA protein